MMFTHTPACPFDTKWLANKYMSYVTHLFEVVLTLQPGHRLHVLHLTIINATYLKQKHIIKSRYLRTKTNYLSDTLIWILCRVGLVLKIVYVDHVS